MKLGTCTEWLFFHLWKKNPNTSHSCNGVFVADTVIYRWAQPYFRYFTAQNGQIIRKTKERVFVEQVESSFSQENTVAVLLTSQSHGKQAETINFEYFNQHDFHEFLFQRDKELNLIIQKFIFPKNDFNHMIKVTWSPQFCLIHRKTNINNIHETKKPMYERVCTFEGPEYLATSDSINSPILSSDLEQLCVNIVKHIQEVSGGNIQIIRMTLYFKVDKENRIWLLFCTGIKVKDKFSESIQRERAESPIFRVIRRDLEPVLTRNENVQKLVKFDHEGMIERLLYQQDNICSNCDLWAQDLYNLQFEHIIQSFERSMVSNDFTRLPDELNKIKIKGELKNKEVKLNNNIKRRSNQYIKKEYQIQNLLEPKSQNSSRQQDILVEKYQIVHNKKTFDEVHAEVQQMCQELDDEQEDMKINFKSIPALILKVWGKIGEDKFLNLKSNPSWRKITTQVCEDCYLKFTECCNLTQFERKVNTAAVNLRRKVDEHQKEQLFQNQMMSINTKSQQSLPLLFPSNQEIKLAPHKPSLFKPQQSAQQRSTAQNTPPHHAKQAQQLKKMIQPTETAKRSKIVTTSSVRVQTKQIYKNRQGLVLSLNQSINSKSSKTTLDQSKLSFDYMIKTVGQLKQKLLELEDEENLKNRTKVIASNQRSEISSIQQNQNYFATDINNTRLEDEIKSEVPNKDDEATIKP